MKNISLILNVVLFIAVGFLFFDRYSGGSNDRESSKSDTTASSDLVVYVHVDSLLDGYDLYNEMKTQMIQKQKKLETELNSKSKSFERKAMEFQEKVEKRLVTSSQAQEMQQKLAAEQQTLLAVKDQMQYELMQDEQSLNKQLYDSIQLFLKDYNKTKKHKLIISTTAAGPLLLGDNKLDITADVLKGLNERYNSSPKTEVNNETKK